MERIKTTPEGVCPNCEEIEFKDKHLTVQIAQAFSMPLAPNWIDQTSRAQKHFSIVFSRQNATLNGTVNAAKSDEILQ